MLVFALNKATKQINSHTGSQESIRKRAADDIDTMNKKKVTNGNDAETAVTTASINDFPAKCLHTGLPVSAPTS